MDTVRVLKRASEVEELSRVQNSMSSVKQRLESLGENLRESTKKQYFGAERNFGFKSIETLPREDTC
jgi:hypothetical protein